MKKLVVEVDMEKYCEVFNFSKERNRRLDYTYDWEEMEVTPQQLKELIDKGVSIKTT